MNLSKLVNSKGKCSKLTKHAINHNFDHNHNFVTCKLQDWDIPRAEQKRKCCH